MKLTLDKIFYAYMAFVGVAAGAVLVALPGAREFFITPFFWMLIAVALFEAGNAFAPRPGKVLTLTNISRGIGFVIGMALLAAVTMLAGVTVRYV